MLTLYALHVLVVHMEVHGDSPPWLGLLGLRQAPGPIICDCLTWTGRPSIQNWCQDTC